MNKILKKQLAYICACAIYIPQLAGAECWIDGGLQSWAKVDPDNYYDPNIAWEWEPCQMCTEDGVEDDFAVGVVKTDQVIKCNTVREIKASDGGKTGRRGFKEYIYEQNLTSTWYMVDQTDCENTIPIPWSEGWFCVSGKGVDIDTPQCVFGE